jgi:hypothetical protein
MIYSGLASGLVKNRLMSVVVVPFPTTMFLMLLIQVEDPRLDCAILRPMESDGDHFLAYHLTKDDESALEFKERRRNGAPTALEEEPQVCIMSSSTQKY